MSVFPLQAFALPIIQSPLGLPHVLTLAAALFALGLFATLTHRSWLRILFGLSLMLLAGMLNLVAFTTYLHPAGLSGHAITLVLALFGLAQLSIGLALVGMMLRRASRPAQLILETGPPAGQADKNPAPESDALDVDRYDDLKW